jgi:hypothetical protein
MPSNPKECLLEAGVTGDAFLLPVVGLFFFTVGIVGSIVLSWGW